jgi:hypothetical protein
MNNLYHRFAVASVGIALGFALGANKEAKAATFTFTSTRSFWVIDKNQDGVGDDGSDYPAGERYTGLKLFGDDIQLGEYRSFYQFNIGSLPLDSNTRITSTIFRTSLYNAQNYDPPYTNLNIYGYTETEVFQSLFDNDNEKYLGGGNVKYSLEDGIFASYIPREFINQRIGNNDSFWLGIRPSDDSFATLSRQASLTITTAVPEPTTIFGSALALGVGGWLKRKKSSQQNKTTSQH